MLVFAIVVFLGRCCRDINIETGLLQQANGSSRVTFSTCDEGTAVVAAVKAEIVSLEAAASDAGSRPGATDGIQTSASITAAALSNLSKDQRNTMETTIAAVIKRTLLTSGALNLENVRISFSQPACLPTTYFVGLGCALVHCQRRDFVLVCVCLNLLASLSVVPSSPSFQRGISG